ncbi:hypothetical protein D3C72_2179830 [compost metagenome]
MVPAKELLALEPPLPLKRLSPSSSVAHSDSSLSLSGTVIGVRLAEPLRLALEAAFLLALTCSLRTMVRMSPTMRGRRSSNNGWKPCRAW